MRPQRSRAAATIASRVSPGDVGLERNALAARLPRHRDGILGGGKIVVNGQHFGAFLREAQHRGAAVAHAGRRATDRRRRPPRPCP